MTQRGDLVTVSLQGDYDKPRPALVIQSDLLTDLESVVLCPVTNDLRNTVFRVTVEPNPANGLHTLSQVMVDKLSTLPRTKISEPFGRLDADRMKAIDRALLLVIGVI
ncbi:type II toxin-antitoxin system PemK/MazF family toxin [Extensimonas perlucida]|uniref:type II toxin-antitoxin system PemK/MazF family toxin n=1 Tax=Extensimonas perlucida TaxID=2590786 RepID=UPI0011A436CB|nr:type II toxin-antitoxin system PemK/MazF family toxin [Extensimonas perlucida]